MFFIRIDNILPVVYHMKTLQNAKTVKIKMPYVSKDHYTPYMYLKEI